MVNQIAKMKPYDVLKVLSDKMNLIILGYTRRMPRTKTEIVQQFSKGDLFTSTRIKRFEN